MATGAYLSVKRNGKWQAVEIDQLTNLELEELEQQQPESGWIWAKFLAKWIRDYLYEDTHWYCEECNKTMSVENNDVYIRHQIYFCSEECADEWDAKRE